MAEPTEKAQTANGERYGWILTVLLEADDCSFILVTPLNGNRAFNDVLVMFHRWQKHVSSFGLFWFGFRTSSPGRGFFPYLQYRSSTLMSSLLDIGNYTI